MSNDAHASAAYDPHSLLTLPPMPYRRCPYLPVLPNGLPSLAGCRVACLVLDQNEPAGTLEQAVAGAGGRITRLPLASFMVEGQVTHGPTAGVLGRLYRAIVLPSGDAATRDALAEVTGLPVLITPDLRALNLPTDNPDA